MCQDFRASPARAARVRAVTRPGLRFERRPPPPPGFLAAARALLGEDGLATDPAELIPYELDAGQDRATPHAVAFPRSAAELVEVVRLARRHGVAVIPRAAGTSLSGGSIPVLGGVVVALTRMARVRAVDPVARQATVDPCVVNLELQAALAPEGLFFPPDPASQRASTIGGNIAENAGGPHCFKYGVTTSYVQALDLVLPSGDVARAGGPAADYPEYDFTGLFTGSEGTLGFVSGATVRAVRQPPAALVLMAIFDGLGPAAEAVSDIIARGLVPAALEIMDQAITRAVEAYAHVGLPTDAAVILIAEVDGYAEALEEQAAVIRERCQAHGAREVRLARDPAEREALWFARKSAAGAIAHLAPAYYLQDGTVPRSRLGELMAEVERVGRAHGLSICNVFHAGDGNLHPLILFDPEVPEQAARVVAASREILARCIEVGGAITGEHGVGVEKIAEMAMQFTPGELQVMREVKDVLDPDDRCNPGKIFPPVAVDPAEWAPRLPAPGAERCHEPASTAEVAALLRDRQARGTPVEVVGSGTKRSPWAAAAAAEVLSTRRLDREIEYAPHDLYLRAGAGMTLGEVQALCARDGLWWPLAHPWPGATLGGIVASGWNAPSRARFGALRDLVLGGVVVLGDGRHLRVGGKVVKNVAGYDLTKLHVGALGTLGVLTEVNLRLGAPPARQASLLARCHTAAEAVTVAQRAARPALVASGVLVVAGGGARALAGDGAAVVLSAAGHPADVAAEVRLLAPALPGAEPFPDTADAVWCAWHRGPGLGGAALLRAGVPAARLKELVAHPALAGADLVADAAAGLLWASLPDGAVAGVAALQEAARGLDGYALVLRRGGDPAASIDPWGHRPSLGPWMERLRRRWDPARVLHRHAFGGGA